MLTPTSRTCQQTSSPHEDVSPLLRGAYGTGLCLVPIPSEPAAPASAQRHSPTTEGPAANGRAARSWPRPSVD